MKAAELNKLINIAKGAARGAGAMLINSAKSHFSVKEKASFDLVTSADIAANNWIRENLLKNAPESMVMAEEDETSVKEALKKAAHHEILWIVDPLDGTTNFSKHVPHVGVSIAAYQPATKELLVGCVYDPWRKECFTAMKGNGAKLNGEKIYASEVDNFHSALAATGFSYSNRRSPDNNLSELAPFVRKCLGVRRFGAASLDLAWIACSRFDIYWEKGLKPWDVAAGILIVREAGGLCSDFTGRDSSIFDDEIVATNSNLHSKVLKQIKQSRTKAGLK